MIIKVRFLASKSKPKWSETRHKRIWSPEDRLFSTANVNPSRTRTSLHCSSAVSKDLLSVCSHSPHETTLKTLFKSVVGSQWMRVEEPTVECCSVKMQNERKEIGHGIEFLGMETLFSPRVYAHISYAWKWIIIVIEIYVCTYYKRKKSAG